MIPGLTIIGERINPGFASSKALLERRDLAGLQRLAVEQVQKGAACLNINTGAEAERDPAFMVEVVRAVQAVVDVPLSLDSPALHVQEAVLTAYDPARARGVMPIVNSVAETRWELMALRRILPFRVILMASERLEDGVGIANRSGADVHATARRMVARARAEHRDLAPGDCIVDVSVCPLASDTENSTRTAVEAIAAIGGDPALRGVHMSVGLSNLGILLPPKSVAGLPLKHAVENAFLTCTVPRGLDMILATAGRGYALLPEEHPVLAGFRAAIAEEGYEVLVKVREMYRAA